MSIFEKGKCPPPASVNQYGSWEAYNEDDSASRTQAYQSVIECLYKWLLSHNVVSEIQWIEKNWNDPNMPMRLEPPDPLKPDCYSTIGWKCYGVKKGQQEAAE